jgi:uncharacterized protein
MLLIRALFRQWWLLAPLTSLLSFGGVARAAELRLNEIRIDQPGPDTHEFFELSGAPGADLDGYSYVVIGDGYEGHGGSGVVETIVSLDGMRLDADGLLVVQNERARFENADNVTHMLVRLFRGDLGEDLDDDDDGLLDRQPFDEIVDRVALLATDPDLAGDRIYAHTRVGPDRGFVPAHVFRDGARWVIGSYEIGDDNTPGRDNLESVVARRKAARIAR